ncbi:Pkinase-domain-containing protein, partial [Ascobolus immersus RN42]
EGKAAGYLIGRHRECDLMLTDRLVSNRHCVIFMESSSDGPKAWIEDLSSNGTRIKGTTIGRNNRRLLNDADEIEISPNCILLFRYPRHRFIGRFAEAYKLGPLLGSGHFASVYKATSTTTGRLVAVKLFLNARRVSSFQQEVAVLMSVTHPSILSLRETFDEADRVYLILEYCPLGELFNLIIDRSKLSEPDTRHIFTQLFDGTQYLHERGIVHRDIKPENILVVDASLTVKLADFGLAKIIGEDSFTTSLCGTPSYVAPEVLANSKERQYSIPVDIWSLGVVLYICLCGFPPFSDELFSPDYPYNLVQQISEGLYEFPSPYWDAIADPALELISAMLCVDPDKRIGVREARRHAWMVGEEDATSEISEGLEGLGLKRRRGRRERTLICEMEGSRVGTGLSEETVRPLREVKGAGNVLEKAKKVAEGKVKGVENEKEGKKEEVETVQASEVEDERGEPVDEA